RRADATNIVPMPVTPPSIEELPDSVTTDEFWTLFGRIEHERLDFKEQISDLETTIAAMAMADGGVILLGVSDTRTLVGCAETQEVIDRVTTLANTCVSPV